MSLRSTVLMVCLSAAPAGLFIACDGGGSTAPGTTAPATGSTEDIGEVLATVNGVSIGTKEFLAAAERKAPANGDTLSEEEKKEVLDGLVEEKLLYAEALKKGLDKDPKVQKVMVNTLLREEVYATVKNSDFTDELLQTYYDEHKSEFIVPEKVQIRRILIKVTEERPDSQAKAEADKLAKEVAAKPDSFKDVAAKYSEDMYKRRGGDVGFVSKEGKPGLDQAIVEKAFMLETGKVSDAFKTADGYNIVMVATRREQVERTFQQMKGSVLRKVKNDKMKELYDTYIAKIRTGSTVKVEDGKLAVLEVKSSRRPGGLPGMPMLGGEDEEGDEGHDDGPPGMGDGTNVPPGLREGAPGTLKIMEGKAGKGPMEGKGERGGADAKGEGKAGKSGGQ
jgi:peptidyl-prolyl cis-trans isomerase C